MRTGSLYVRRAGVQDATRSLGVLAALQNASAGRFAVWNGPQRFGLCRVGSYPPPVTAARKAPRLCPGHRLSNGWRCRPDTFSEPYRSFETNRVFPNRIRGVNRLTAAIATTCAGSQRLPVFTFGTNDGAPLQNSKTLAWPGAMGEAPAYFAVTGTPNGGRNDLSLKNDFTVILDRVETNAAPAQPVQPESKPSK